MKFLQDTYTRAGPLYSFKWWGKKFRRGLSLLGTKFWNYVRTVKIVTYHAMIYSLGCEYPSQYGGSFRHRSLCREISRQKTDIRPQSTLGRSWLFLIHKCLTRKVYKSSPPEIPARWPYKKEATLNLRSSSFFSQFHNGYPR